MAHHKVEELVDELFQAFEAGDLARAGRCFSPGATLAQHFGAGAGVAKPIAEALGAVEGLVKVIGLPKYHNRRKLCTADGFVEQHVSELKPPGAKHPVRIEASLVGRIDAATGLVSSLEEYLDPSPLMGPSAKPKAKPKTAKAASSPANLEGAVVVVSGASSGIGEGIALECARLGGKLVLTARREAELQRVAAACRGAGAREVALVAGDTRDEACVALVAEAAGKFGGVDRLYVNAGISQNTDFLDAPVSVVRDMMEVNFFGGVLLTRACLPSLIERKGRIAAISSVQGRCPAPRNTGYSASKHAMHGFFESLRAELEPKGVGVTMVLPGPVATDILSNLHGPGGKQVALVMDGATKAGLTTAAEAGCISVAALEAGEREVVFPKDMASLVALRAASPAKADALVATLYRTMQTSEVPPSAKL